MLRQLCGDHVLLVQPGGIPGNQRLQPVFAAAPAKRSPTRPWTAARPRPHGPGSAGSRRPASHVVHTAVARRAPGATSPVHRAGPPDRVLQPVAVLQVQALHLRDQNAANPVPTGRAPAVVRPPRLPHEAWSEHPHRGRDKHQGFPVVAQRDLNQHPPRCRVGVAVQAQTDRIAQPHGHRLASRQISQPDRAGFLDGCALVMPNWATGFSHWSVCTVS